MYTIRAYYLQYCGSYAPHRRRRTPDDGRWTMDAGRWTMDAGPSTPYYKLTGELKSNTLKYLTSKYFIKTVYNVVCITQTINHNVAINILNNGRPK